jgi:hypothetical protein
MTRNAFLTLLLLFITGSAFAEKIEFRPDGKIEYDFFYNELDRILAERGDEQLGSLTLNEVNVIAEELSISIQKTAFVESSRHASLVFPGLGQFRNGDSLGGSLFVAANVVTVAGTLLLSYALLPEDLKWDKTNPFTDNFSDVSDAWGNQSFVDYLPSMGAFFGGVLVNVALRIISANHAETLARENIEKGVVEFQPYSFIGFHRLGGPMGMGKH